MKSDPASRRARNVVLLVIITVALPSLVLTALGIAAIRNEEVATKRRIERLYRPLLMEVTDDFNHRFDWLLGEAEPALRDLLEWSHDTDFDLARFRRFVASHPAATNFFVLDEEGDPLAPDFKPHYDSECCFCFDVKDYHPARSTDECPPRIKERQIQRLLSAPCRQWGFVDDDTARWVTKLLLSPIPTDDLAQRRFVANVASLVSRLADPTRGINPAWAQSVARALMFRFESLPPDLRRWAGGILILQSQRQSLLSALSKMTRSKSKEPVVVGLAVSKLRRLVVLLRVKDRTAGFEIVPTPLERKINRLLADRDLAGRLAVRVSPLVAPKWWTAYISPGVFHLTKEQREQRFITWLLCSRSNMNWAFEMVVVEPGMLADLGRSRSGLYMWSLILVGFALVSGIAYTVRSVMHEARLSRLKTDFVSSVSHDLRTPLTSIRMFSETLRAGRYATEEERREFLQIIIEEAERLSRLTERILDFSRMEAGRKSYRKTTTDVASLVDHALRASKPMIDAADFTVEVETQENLPQITVDRDAMVEVLINLFTNAIKYSPDARWMGVLITADAEEVRIAVTDHGIGIRKVDHARIFEKFYRVDTRRAAEVGGSGIGLSLVKHIIDTHGGTIEVQSKPGAGSTFAVRLPITPAGTVDSAELGPTGDRAWTAS